MLIQEANAVYPTVFVTTQAVLQAMLKSPSATEDDKYELAQMELTSYSH